MKNPYKILIVLSFCFLLGNTGKSVYDLKEGEEIDGWKIEKSVRGEMVDGMMYDSYLVLKGQLKTTVKYYNSLSYMDGNDFRVYFSKDALEKLPIKILKGGINIEFPNDKLIYPLSEGSYGTMEVVIDSIRINRAPTDANADFVSASEVININEKGAVAEPYPETDVNNKRYRIQNKEAQEFIKSAPFTIDNIPTTTLHSVAESGNKAEVIKLLKEGVDINAVDVFGDTPLLKSIKYNKADVAEILLENNANVNLANHLKETPLHIAAKNKEAGIVEALLKKGADINLANNNGNTALHDAVKSGHPEIITLLINAGVNVTAKNISGRTPLYYARNFEVVKLLLGNGSKFSELDDEGFEILSFAVNKRDREFVKFLIKNGIDINLKKDLDGGSVLYFIKEEDNQKDNFDFIKFLFDNGLDVNAQDNYSKKTALHEAAWMSIPMGVTEKYVEFLLKNKANPNIQDNKGETPLHSAAFFMQIPNVKLLLNYGANPTIKNQNGKTPVNIVEEQKVRSEEDKNKQEVLLMMLNKENNSMKE